MKLYTLLHSKDAKPTYTDAELAAAKQRLTPYFLCAVQLHRSLRVAGVELAILTNSRFIIDHINAGQYDIEVVEFDFTMAAPKESVFYSAHFKVDAYRFLASSNEPYVGIVDSDVSCINQMTPSLRNVIRQQLPVYYDITNQMAPAYGFERVVRDKEKVMGRSSIGLWAGGEFIAGPPTFFQRLVQEVELIQDQYLKVWNTLFHASDETLTSVALENLMAGGYHVHDAGALGVIERFWSINTRHHQKPLTSCTDSFLLHLPADKDFLAARGKEESFESFLKKYRHRVRSRLPRRLAARVYRRFVPQRFAT